MKQRPSIALAMIVKNEAHNLSSLLSSVSGCFDEIHITDTGSTDDTVKLLEGDKCGELAGCPIFVHHFKWVNDFSKARQYSFDQVPEHIDYVLWMDGDDVLHNKEAFIHFRDHTMHCCHQWIVPYLYAFNEHGESVCTFYRERVVKNNYGFRWKYFVHEGLIYPTDRKVATQNITIFDIRHMRTEEDIKQDRTRNLKLFKDNEEELEPRMKYYWGKELFEAQEFIQSIQVLTEVCKNLDQLEFFPHDRIMAMQYLSMAYSQCGKWIQSMNVALLGIQLCPERAEFWNLCADALVRQNKFQGAIVCYEASRKCPSTNLGGMIYTSPQSFQDYPTYQLAQIYLNVGQYALAQKETDLLKEYKNPLWEKMQAELDKLSSLNEVAVNNDLIQSDDIVITTPPGGVTEDWDELTLETKGIGGSETACVEIARLLHKKTKKPVKVFMKRQSSDLMPSGVEYHPISHIEGYFRKYKPLRHIAWRHSVKLTTAPTYIWSHDLVTPGGEDFNRYDKYWCLTGFHREFVKDMQGVPDHKIDLIRNGIEPKLFEEVKDVVKNPYKVIFSSSPDRGLERCIEIVKRVKRMIPEVELHIFYGTGNMRKMGMVQEADRLDALIKDNDFVVYHGFVKKHELIRHMKESSVWLYPADFIETSCITAMEALCAGTYPLVRDMGALKYTLKEAIEKDMCTFIWRDAVTPEDFDYWATELSLALTEQKYKKVDVCVDDYSWETVVDDYIKSMQL